MRRSRETWKQLVAKYRASGATAEAFARKHRLNVGTLRWWSGQLRKEAPSVRVQFVPVRSKPTSVPAAGLVEAQLGPVTLRFESGTDVQYVSALLQGLVKSC
jgi:transposase-like protein